MGSKLENICWTLTTPHSNVESTFSGIKACDISKEQFMASNIYGFEAG
jgi:hypothetical protein